MVADPWSMLTIPQAAEETNNASNLNFENDFSQEWHNQEPSVDDQDPGDYVALDDSEQYLARLEQKLGRLSGSSGPSGSRALLAGLSASRQTHQHALLSDTGPSSSSSLGESDYLPRARGLLLTEGQHHLNSIMQKLAPEKLALSAEELVKLLAADSLSAKTDEPLTNGETNDQVADTDEYNTNETNDLADTATGARVGVEPEYVNIHKNNVSSLSPAESRPVTRMGDAQGKVSTGDDT